jgi:hypothetical protein
VDLFLGFSDLRATWSSEGPSLASGTRMMFGIDETGQECARTHTHTHTHTHTRGRGGGEEGKEEVTAGKVARQVITRIQGQGVVGREQG